ncbi:DUF4870 domain-containing protein [Planctomycetota bacterium]|nr:DUF4870 domain-containing protein [Planctomycetota bacterium]
MNAAEETNADKPAENADNEVVATDEIPQEEKTMGMLCYLFVFLGLPIPFGNIIGPLVLWLIKKDEMPFVDKCGKEILNFQITAMIAITICGSLFFLAIPLILIPVIAIADGIFTVLGTIKAYEGKEYQYPFAIRFIK